MGGFRKPALALLLAFVTVNLGIVLAAGLPWEGKNPVARLDLAAEGVFNANKTGHTGLDGFDGYLRNASGQSVHQSFLLNTNSCASCHLTHTAPGEKLLFQRSVYNTCTACHFDGTMNTYDILREAGLAGGRFYDGGEPFAFDVSGRSGVSFHLATGLKTTGEAPGADPSLEGWWERPFTCGSCHAPHGTYSGRHLHYNVNGRAASFRDVPLVEGEGGRFRPAPPYDGYAPWLYDEAEGEGAGPALGVEIINALDEAVTNEFFVHYQEGYVLPLGNPGPAPYRITFTRAFVTDIEVIPAEGQSPERVIYRRGVVDFCTACHSGYLETLSRDGRTYYYTRHAAFEHPINTDIRPYVASGFIREPDPRFRLEEDRPAEGEGRRLVCLSCHFAHGTDAELILDSTFSVMYPGGEGAPEETHLLRFGGRESCLVCHYSMPADTLAVKSTIPFDAQTTGTVPGEIRVKFDRRVGPDSVPGNVTVYDSVYQDSVPGTFWYDDDYRTVVFVPEPGALEEGKEYTVDISSAQEPSGGVLSWFGRALATLYRFVFTVGSSSGE